MDHQRNSKPPMAQSDEANESQLKLARGQGDALQDAIDRMVGKVAHDGKEIQSGDYLVGYAVEEAEGMYKMKKGKLTWHEPKKQNMHLEVSVRDASDRRFIPELKVRATLIDEGGKKVGTHRQRFLWHPWLYHYGRNWRVPGDGQYRLRVQIDAPTFSRHDKKNGKRFLEPVDVEFKNVNVKTGRK